jgi:S-adenosylmethionine-diacylglycerol 3-amino-3-carboxypropyl transferase
MAITDKVFSSIHLNNLVYNTCWEDPRCDRQLLNLQSDSRIVMITSAGCNALDYLLDDPAHVHCIDMNPRQNALMELKRASLRVNRFEDHFQIFGQGRHPGMTGLYEEGLRNHLPGFARDYWDSRLRFFNGKGIRKTFYHYGTSGFFAWIMAQYLKSNRRMYRLLEELFQAETLTQQAEIYQAVEPRILNRMVEWAMNRNVTLYLLGVPKSQRSLMEDQYPNGHIGFIQDALRRVFTTLPIRENYFWKLYFQGHYDSDCAPEYLMPANFDTLKSRQSRVSTHTTTISAFLRENPGTYSHFILLDHQDWLAANDRDALQEEWDLILQNSRPGTRILLRSAASEVDFFPENVLERVTFEQELTAATHLQDRVGTYASVYLAIVN